MPMRAAYFVLECPHWHDCFVLHGVPFVLECPYWHDCFVLEYPYGQNILYWSNLPEGIFCNGIPLPTEYFVLGVTLLTEYFVLEHPYCQGCFVLEYPYLQTEYFVPECPYGQIFLYWSILTYWIFCTGISLGTESFVLENPYWQDCSTSSMRHTAPSCGRAQLITVCALMCWNRFFWG